MQLRYVKTAAGQSEIQSRSRPLGRPVRNLLLVINDSQTVEYWLESVKGTTEQDLILLETEGLIEPLKSGSRSARPRPASDAGPASVPPAGAANSQAPNSGFASSGFSNSGYSSSVLPLGDGDNEWGDLQTVIQGASYPQLYDALTSQGKALLGLMRGFRFVLEVEKCSGLPELQGLAMKFAEQLRDEQGMNSVRRFGNALRKG